MNDQTQSTVAATQSPSVVTCGGDASPSMSFTQVRENPYLCAKTLKFVATFLESEKGTLEDNDFFHFIVHILGKNNALDLARRSCSFDGLRGITKGMLEESHEDVASHVLADLWSHSRTHAAIKKALLAALANHREQWDRTAAETKDQDVIRRRFEELSRLLGLTDVELDMLLLAYVRYADVWDWSSLGRMRAARRAFQRICVIARILALPQAVAAKYLLENAKLRSLGCLDSDLDFRSELEPFLIGLSEDPLASKYFVRCHEPALPWPMHGNLTEEHGEWLKRLICNRDPNRGLNILLYGAPGTGKTSFALSLAAELGYELYRIRGAEEFDSDPINIWPRFAALRICDGQANHDRSLILIDEADDMLDSAGGPSGDVSAVEPNGRTDKKETLNIILDQLKTPCIWITNNQPYHLAPSSRRRFDYSIEFAPLSQQKRQQVWKNLRLRYGLAETISDEMIESLARRFPISAGGIDLALRNFSRLARDPAVAPTAMDSLEHLLRPHCELMGIDPNENASIAANDYSLSGLNIRGPIGPERLLQAARQFIQRQVVESPTDRRIPGPAHLAVLLSGPPGTGKTEFVKFLSRELDCHIRTVMPGDLLSRYVGGTEQNIRRVFRAAAADKAILFLDEADGLFRSRSLSDRSWEVTQVNELLSAMDQFVGILVCATNSVEMLDAATIRRFTFKLQFDYLDAAGKGEFYRRLLAEICPEPLDGDRQRRLNQIADLAPGDFYTVRRAMSYLGEGHNATHDDLLTALETESRAKRLGKSGNFGFGRG
ncbi:MAG: AAA family ATPase [Phycisphaerae bacterium]